MSNTILDNLVKCFNNSNLGVNLTTILIDNEPWFIAKEVAALLGYENTEKTIRTHVDEEDQKMLSCNECKELFGSSLVIEGETDEVSDQDIADTETVGSDENLKPTKTVGLKNSISISNRGMKLINESGLYTLITRSKKKEAKPFRRWVTSEVLPSIRKTGSYGLQISEHDTLLLNAIKAKTDEERVATLKALDEYHTREKRALEAENEELKNTNDELLTENELWRGNYLNTKQIYEILERDYLEALKQAKSTNYNKLRKGLCDITNEKKQGRKVYKKHVTNDKGETEWRQEYYFEKGILDTLLERVKDSIKYIFNIRLR